MPFKAELNAITKAYVKLMKLPVKDLLPALKVADVVSDDQRERMNAMMLDKDRAVYLIDTVIIPTLKVDNQELFYNFLQVLEDQDNAIVKVIAKDLRSQLGPSMPPQSYGGSVHPSHQGQSPQQYPSYEVQTPPQPDPPYHGQAPSQQYSPYQRQTAPQQYSPYQGQMPPQPPQQYSLHQRQTPPQQYSPYHGQMPPQQYSPYQGQTPPQQYSPYQRQTSPQQYSPYQRQTPPQQYSPYQGQTPPQQYSPYQRQTPPQQYSPYQGQTPPQQYSPYQGQTPPQRYSPYQGQTPPQQYSPYQGQTPPQQYSPYQRQTSPQQFSPYHVQMPPQQYSSYQRQTPPQQYFPYQGQMQLQQYTPHQEHPMMLPQGEPLRQPCASPSQMIKVENYLESKKGTECLPANNRNVHGVCLIRGEFARGRMTGTGFIGNLTMPNSSSPVTVLVTNHHVIQNLNEALVATYEFSYLRDDNMSHVIKGKELISRNPHRFYTCKEFGQDCITILLDYAVIQVCEEPLNNTIIKSQLDGEEFPLSACKFDLDNPAIPSDAKQMETICMFHYPRGQPLKRSAQGSVSVGHLLFYACDTDVGSSGAPVFKVVNEELKLVALHRAYWGDNKFNFGTLITKVIEHIKNGGPAAWMNYHDTCSMLQSLVNN